MDYSLGGTRSPTLSAWLVLQRVALLLQHGTMLLIRLGESERRADLTTAINEGVDFAVSNADVNYAIICNYTIILVKHTGASKQESVLH